MNIGNLGEKFMNEARRCARRSCGGSTESPQFQGLMVGSIQGKFSVLRGGCWVLSSVSGQKLECGRGF